MTATWRGALPFLGIFIFAVSGFIAIPASPSAPGFPRTTAAQKIEARAEYPRNEFEPDHDGDASLLRFRFQDSLGRSHSFSCRIGEWEDRELRAQEGLDECPGNNRRASLGACHEKGESIQWHWTTQAIPSVPSLSQYMQLHGLRCGQGKWILDYDYLIKQSLDPLADCSDAVQREIGDNPEMLMAFFLSMPYDYVPDVDEDAQRWTAGFRVPTSVMLLNEGDCDSKAALFCAFRYRHHRRIVIFRSVRLKDGNPLGHAMVGIESGGDAPNLPERLPDATRLWDDEIPGDEYSEGKPLKFAGREYIPVDVTGPGDIRYGQVPLDKEGWYEAIPISASNSGIETEPAESCEPDMKSQASSATPPRASLLSPPGSPP